MIPSWNGDGVFTGRESHTSHRNQMTLINVITVATVTSASLISAQASDAYPSVTTICNELRVELQKGVEDGSLNRKRSKEF